MNGRLFLVVVATFLGGLAPPPVLAAADPPPVIGDVEGQPLAQNADRLMKALDMIGAPLEDAAAKQLKAAIDDKDAKKVQQILDPRALFVVNINPEARVKVARGPAEAKLQQAGYVPALVKIVNDSTVKKTLRISSPQSGERFSGRGERNPKDDPKIVNRFLQVEMFTAPPMTADLSGLKVEYAIALIYSTEPGKREATISFDIGQGNQDLGFRGEVPVLFDVKPAIPVKVSVTDFDGKPTVARLTITDAAGHVFPPQPKRLGQDFFFQKQIYRPDGGTVLLPPGRFTVETGRGPEYKVATQKINVVEGKENEIAIKLERWINPMDAGWYNGDHHIHAAGCAHYTNPTEGVMPEDMFLHVKGEGMNVGCCLTWGPCYDFQRKFFEPTPNNKSEPFTLLKYDVEVSGFGSQALGHVCLLNLRDQTYPGSDGTSTKGWPTWTTPVLRWARAQGAVTGYAHSGSGLEINPGAAARRLLASLDKDADGALTPAEGGRGLLPGEFTTIDADRDGVLTRAELETAHATAAETLPNLAIPEMSGVGAMEVVVSVPQGVCDFMSAMDTPRIAEWNMWYHLLNCGFPLKVSGETDFPCMSGLRVGQGRVYVRLGDVGALDFGAWCAGLAAGRSYVSDGFAHALEFRVGDKRPGDTLRLDQPGTIEIRAKVAFAERTPLAVAHGSIVPAGGRRLVGDTVNLHGPRRDGEFTREGQSRRVELVVNGQVVASRDVPADDGVHDLSFGVPIERTSWVALRQFPQMHTNPVDVIVAGRPVRASRRSALWCLGSVQRLWETRGRTIAPAERGEARAAFDQAIEMYRRIASEAPEGS
jgi:hypothetical protein